jgi:hypothetical protein
MKPWTEAAVPAMMAERLHRDGVEVRADPAELEHRQAKSTRSIGSGTGPKSDSTRPDRADDEEANQSAVREPAHAELADQTRVQEGR